MSQGQDLAQEHMASKWQGWGGDWGGNQMPKAFTRLGAPPQFSLFLIICPALRGGNDEVWKGSNKLIYI